jgi:hypothetical protein
MDMFRREFLAASAAGLASSSLLAGRRAGRRRPRVAAIYTVFTYRSHAHVLLENFLQPYLFNGQLTDPGVDVVSFYRDQSPDGDMTGDVSQRYGIPVYKSIREALCLGGDQLAVDAVLSIGEHGSYPKTELGQTMYPRKRFFDEILQVMKDSSRFVPVFNDKHLSYRWDWASEMVDACREHGIPLLAGSSVPLAERQPAIEFPRGAVMEEAISIHGGPVESYDFHALEVLQSIVEARRGGETGIKQVRFFEAKAVRQNARQGYWSENLVAAAMKAQLGYVPADLGAIKGEDEIEPHAIQLTYNDGLKATVLRVGHDSTRWNFACRLKQHSRPLATAFNVGPWENRNLFKALAHAIQHHFRTGKPSYPVERTLLVTGTLAAAMQARQEESGILPTPHLAMRYQASNFKAMREMGESWKIITDDAPQPPGIHGEK